MVEILWILDTLFATNVARVQGCLRIQAITIVESVQRSHKSVQHGFSILQELGRQQGGAKFKSRDRLGFKGGDM